jgi:hypothetical protein
MKATFMSIYSSRPIRFQFTEKFSHITTNPIMTSGKTPLLREEELAGAILERPKSFNEVPE